MRKRIAALALVLSLPLALAAENASPASKDWFQWRGPRRDNISLDTGLLKQWPKDGLKLIWDSKVVNAGKSVGTGYSSVTIAGGRIFTMGDIGGKGSVVALDEKTGKVIWTTPISGPHGDGTRCTPTVDDDRVYALSPQGVLACLDAQKGTIVWQKHLEKDFGGRMMSGWRYSESPFVDGDKLVCTPGGESAALVALDKYKGTQIWGAPIAQPYPGKNPDGHVGAGYASIVVAEVAGKRVYINLLGRSRGLVGVDADTGKLLFSYNKMANSTANIPTTLVRGNLVFCSTGYGSGAALLELVPKGDGIEAVEKYFLKGGTLQNHHGGMVMLGDYVYGGHGHNDGRPFCFNWKTKAFAWGPEESPGGGSAAVTYADGNLYFRWDSNLVGLIEAKPDGFNVVSKFQLPKDLSRPGWSHPVVHHGRLYIRGNDRLLCYDVKK